MPLQGIQRPSQSGCLGRWDVSTSSTSRGSISTCIRGSSCSISSWSPELPRKEVQPPCWRDSKERPQEEPQGKRTLKPTGRAREVSHPSVPDDPIPSSDPTASARDQPKNHPAELSQPREHAQRRDSGATPPSSVVVCCAETGN